MPDAGYDNMACLAFDLACVTFANRFERMRDERVEVPIPASERKKKPTKLVPKYSVEELVAMLEIDPSVDDAQAILDDVLDPTAWTNYDDSLPEDESQVT